MTRSLVRPLPLLVLLGSVQLHAQATAKPQTLTGCVARLPKVPDKYVLASGGRCMLLSGSFKAASAADHEIIATGIVLEPEGMAPLTFQIQSTQAVKDACTRTCVLEPPGTRGIHGKERPGREGGTAGATSRPEPQ